MALQETKYSVLGDRVIVLLDEAKDHTITDAGIIVPLQRLTESESGRVKTELTGRKHYLQGTVLQIGALAAKKLEENLSDIKVGDRVYIGAQALNSNGYQWYPDRTKLVADFEGYVCIPHVLIEAKIED